MIFTVRLLETAADINATEALQVGVWGPEGIAPGHVILTAAHNGGLAAGAFVAGDLVGFVWGFLGWDERVHPHRLKHCSHMLGVLPAYRGAGIGEALKRFQYEYVRQQGLELITWTYDPLLAANARLNIAKLGAVCNTYLPDLYGNLADGMNAGLATDRFQVDWWVGPGFPQAPATDPLPEGAQAAVPHPASPFEAPRPIDALPVAPVVTYPIPTDFLALKRANGRLAERWRLASREAFQTLFAAGYVVAGFVHRRGRAFYVLHREADHAH